MTKAHFGVGLLGIALSALVILGPSVGSAHGPGGHDQQAFTPLSAARKGMEVFDKLIAGGKLDESWETRFAAVQVSRRAAAGNGEFIVKLSRDQGDPAAVYIFFDIQGEYRGSNFSGE